ncbi:endolytic transglycosylase MltG [Bacillus sp. NTK071]|uniref:endolytic transglycosylase MltG n=1 Tax=Bacillus sp. NTK071 TaxID=2802175 RepID=UPI001A90B93C|nr:endolytic transglycosylase MltG [Bacillus sp. NTK071]MBN8209188.1 endolytic transglycosylase MltG [Bacillus sp. NTK071]
MSKQEAKGIAAGLLFAAILLTAYYFMFSQATAEEGNQLTDAAVEQHLKENGMVMVKKEEYDSLKVDEQKVTADKQENDEKVSDEEKKEEAESDQPKKVSFTIDEGMTSLEVAQSLADQTLVNKSDDFIDTLQDMNKETAVQPGEYELRTDMSAAEIVDEITR